ncbi:putative Ig domain-containing protein [Larkinella rosea]|uniref:Dystroglycan-type cadherin-like domain-containing protein n=1 Tax=Larkinella rosea TaxID=2025312 RepID=A0A3P1C2K5_9BACT|nr:putative Ig domain-containing protein [Larkinella rosea]RRB07611.1 hypothetical protein EHT25_07475 [Larkinella rosea]
MNAFYNFVHSFFIRNRLLLGVILAYFTALSAMAQTTNTWTGSSSSDWNTSANWSANHVPLATENVVIPDVSPYPVLSSTAVVNSVEVSAASSFTITAAASLTINGSMAASPYSYAFFNWGTVSNSGQVVIRMTESVGQVGLFNRGGGGGRGFTNNADASVQINGSSYAGIYNTSTFNNGGAITIGASASVGEYGVYTSGGFYNNTGGILSIDRATEAGFYNPGGISPNDGTIRIGSLAPMGPVGYNNSGFNLTTNSGIITIDNTTTNAFLNNSSFKNTGSITIGALSPVGAEAIRLTNTFTNDGCGALVDIRADAVITTTNASSNRFNNNDGATIIERASGTSTIYNNSGLVRNLNGGTFTITNSNTGVLTTDAGITANPSLTITQGQSTTLTAEGTAPYTWSSGQNTQSIEVTTSGPYSVTSTLASCTRVSSVTVTVNALPCGTVVYVTQNGAGSQDGSSWDNAYPGTALQTAINTAATCGAQVWVAQGLYKPTADNNREISFSMKNGVAIYGGFAGNEAANYDLSQRNLVTNQTILSGDIDDGGTLANNSYHVIFNESGLTTTAILDGFVITGGYASETGGQNKAIGGGMLNNGVCSPTVRNCSFVGNFAENGGAINNNGRGTGNSSPVLTNCSFQSNTAVRGAAIYNLGITSGNSSPTLTNCSFQSNSATQGGALYNYGSGGSSNPTLTNCVFFGNGGSNTIFNADASPTASYSLFETGASGYSGSNNQTVSVTPFASSTSPELAPNSPAIDAGDPATTSATIGTTDLAGNPRFVRQLDMGALEFQGSISLTLVTSATPNPVCAGTTVALSVTASGGTAPYSYTWTAPAGITLSATSTSAVSASIGAAISGVQTLTITVAASGGSPTSTSLVTISVNPVPSVSITANPSLTIVQGQSTSLTASGADSYLWSTTETSSGISVSTAEPYSVTGTTSGCSSSTTVTVTVINSASATLSGSTTLCPGQPATLSVALTGTQPWSLTYTDGTTPINVSGITSSPYTFTVNPAGTTTYSLVAVATAEAPVNGVVSGSATVTRSTVASAPTLTPSSQSIIQNTPFVTLTISGCPGALNWSATNSTSGTGTTINVPTSAVATIVYSATCVSSCPTPPGSATVTITAPTTTGNFDGFVNGADCGSFRGWAWDRGKPNTVFSVQILDGPNVIGTLAAGDFRQDLLDAGKGNGKHAFRFTIPDNLKDGLAHNLSARIAESSFILKDSPKALICQGGTTPPANKPPVAPSPTVLIAPLAAQVGVPFSGTLAAFTDPEGGALTYDLVGLPNGLMINTTSRVISGTPTVAGDFVLTYTATDPQLATNSVSFVLTISAPMTTTVTGNFEGYLDKVECGTIRGWVWDRNKPNTPVTVEFYTGSTVWGSTIANIYRDDLKNAGKGNGAHAYSFTVPTDLKDGNTRLIYGRVQGSTFVLKDSGKPLTCNLPTRLSAETTSDWQVTVLGNPVLGQTVAVEIRGAEGQPLRFSVTDVQGRIVGEQNVENAKSVERQTLSIGKTAPGILLLRVNTPTISKTVKLVKP